MKHHLNTLFITTQGAYLRKDGEAVAVCVEKQTKLRVPLHMLGGICCFGRVTVSPYLMGSCAEAGVAISYLTENGRLLAKVQGFTPGNVLLRREQYRQAEPGGERPSRATLAVVQPIVIAKLLNSRTVLMRGARDYPGGTASAPLQRASDELAASVSLARTVDDVERLRGVEGEAAATYFAALPNLITSNDPAWKFDRRSRRPPLDAVNALLSFLYTMLVHDARSACEAAGLDPQVGFLHCDRPGRPSLALDLMEELRAFLCDRLALSLINRGQIRPEGFAQSEAGGVVMNDVTRKDVIAAYQKRKQDELTHPFLGERVSVGLVVHLQARLLARYLRNDLEIYPPFIWK